MPKLILTSTGFTNKNRWGLIMSKKMWILLVSFLIIVVSFCIINFVLKPVVNIPSINEIKYVKVVPTQGPGAIRNNNLLILDLNNQQDKGKIENILKWLKSGKYSKAKGIPISNGMAFPYLSIETTSNVEITIMADGVSNNQVLVFDSQHRSVFIVEAPELHTILDSLFSIADSRK